MAIFYNIQNFKLKNLKTHKAAILIEVIVSYIYKSIFKMYESLLRLPYFQGMEKDDITAILDKVTFEFIKYDNGDRIFGPGEKCDRFAILTQGEIQCKAISPDHTICITENITAPYAIEPYSLFGYRTSYRREYTAKEKCTILVIDKQYLFSEFAKHNIFTINLLNLISHKAEKLQEGIWLHTPQSIEGRIAHLIAMRCESHKGTTSVTVKMERIAAILCETRLNISKALNAMQNNGYITLHRGEITVHSMEKLIELIK